jgi:hypothetical protein
MFIRRTSLIVRDTPRRQTDERRKMPNNKAFTRHSYSGAMHRVLFMSIALTIVSASAARAETWYLMAPDEQIVSNPRVATRMEHGPVMGPLVFTSRDTFPSRPQCESARQKLVTDLRQLSVIKRGSWDRYGFTSPSVFTRCVKSDDPMLKRSSADAPPSMETFVNRPQRR